MMTVTFAFSTTQSRRPVRPEWVNVESPIRAIAGWSPAAAAPLAIVIEAPISTQVSIASYGGRAPSV